MQQPLNSDTSIQLTSLGQETQVPGDPEKVLRTEEDETFIRLTLAQDPAEGMELLFRRYYQPLCTHAVKFVGSRDAAEDLVSDIFYQFYSRQLYLTVATSYRAYLFQSVRNRGYNYLRWELNRKNSLEETADFASPESQQPDAVTQYEELYQDVERAINTLPIQRRKIYLLFQFDGRPAKEIAEEMGLSVRTVEVQIQRARQAIRQLVRDKWFLAIFLNFLLS